MEEAPDMDALLDELEGIEHPLIPTKTFETLSDHCAVIDIPVNLRKLSDKDSIRISLEPPEYMDTKDMVDQDCTNFCSLMFSTSELDSEGKKVLMKADLREKEELLESDGDYEEVLDYLNKFDDSVATPDYAGTEVNEFDEGCSAPDTVSDSLRTAAETVALSLLGAIAEGIEDSVKFLPELNTCNGSKDEISENSTNESLLTSTNDICCSDQESHGSLSNVYAVDSTIAVMTPPRNAMVESPTYVYANTSAAFVLQQPSTELDASIVQGPFTDNLTLDLDMEELIGLNRKSSASEDISSLEGIAKVEDETSSECETNKTISADAVAALENKDYETIDSIAEKDTSERSEYVAVTGCKSVNLSKAEIVDDSNNQARESIQAGCSHDSLEIQVSPNKNESKDSSGLETAIECETTEQDVPLAVPSDRFGAPVIAAIHDLSQESDYMRLTESELQLGKSKPYWIPDVDCTMCMLCNSKFSLLNRRHHCRACGRVACGTCCKERAMLEYMRDETKKQGRARVCTPCASMLARIEHYEKSVRENTDRNTTDDATPSTSTGNRVSRGVLKTRTCVSDIETEVIQSPDATEKKRSVVFRDGVKPGATTSTNGVDISMEEKNTTLKPKKKSRKRQVITRRVAELRFEDELKCALPTATRQKYIVLNSNGEMEMLDEDLISAKLREEFPVTIVLKKNLTCVVRVCKVHSISVFCVYSCGFVSIGLDELLFVWQRSDLADFSIPLDVLLRISQIFSTSCDADQAGVRQVCSRLPAIHSVASASPPLPRHILFFPPTVQDFSELSVPNSPFLVAMFLHDAEVLWAMACPNRLLLRIGLKYSWYPTPVVNFIEREAVYSTETSQTVLKVFTDFHSWSFRMKHLVGCTVTLKNDITLVEIPRCAKNDLDEIISLNRTMLAWTTSMNLCADSHLVCDEADGFYSTQVFSRGSTRKATGTSFIIIDGGLKNSGIQISVVEDGVTIRIPSMNLESLLTSLENMQDWSTCDSSGSQFLVHWTDSIVHSSPFGPISEIDGANLSNKFQYGLSLERAISSVIQVNSVSDYGVRLSHVYNLKDGRLSPDDEPKVFSVAEMLARECTGMLEPYLPMLINMNIMRTSIRVSVSAEKVEYDVSPWCGMEEQHMSYKQSMDQLIPVLCDILRYLSDGFHIEFTLSSVLTKSLPYVI